MPRMWKGAAYQPNFDRAEGHAAACQLGEDGLYKATEHLAKRIFQYGAQYYWGKKRSSGCRMPTVVGGTGVGVQHCPQCGSGSYRFAGGVNTCKHCSKEWK